MSLKLSYIAASNNKPYKVKPFPSSHAMPQQKGSALVLAIFIIVVMTVLGASLTRMMSSSAETIAYEVLGTRAYTAAQSGIQWQLQQLFPLGGNTQSCGSISTNIPDISSVNGLKSCEINALTCDEFTYTDGADTVTYYTIESTGQCYISDGTDKTILTSRTIKVEARDL